MRMTNKIMESNSLYNINQNKILQDKLSTQMSTQKKLTRPSDDPVVAIRALRLRTSVSQVTQYQEKNAEDAESWLEVTSNGLSTVTSLLTDLIKNANKGANKDLTASDLDIIITQMENLSDEFYATGNLDYAGRYVFTGFRTDTPMSFTASDISAGVPSYNITEQLTSADFDLYDYTNIGNLDGLTSTNIDSHTEVEQSIKNGELHRIRLAYDKIDSTSISIAFKGVVKDPTAVPVETETITIDPSKITTLSSEEAYKQAQEANEKDGKKIFFAYDTGELIISDAMYEEWQSEDKAATPPKYNYLADDVEIDINYNKSEWTNGDLRPEHYFACTSTQTVDGNTKVIDYNKEYLTSEKEKQVIAYDVGYNQTIEINTTADEVFKFDLKRDIDDLRSALNSLDEIEKIKSDLKTKLESLDPDADATEYDQVKKQYDAADKAYSYIRENMHDMLQSAISGFQKYLDDTNVAVTDNGTRSSRLALISNRLVDQKTTFKTLQSENEDVDIADVAIKLTSSELTYEASLTATSKIMQTTLMNYI